MKGNSKRIYGVKINYLLLEDFLLNLSDIRKARKNHEISKEFEKRIMLAVTQVNGCSLCSYFHTKDALNMGMEKEQIKKILEGDMGSVPEDETEALIFAQHYADMIGNYDQKAWERINAIYGNSRANAILAYIRAIMVGNAQGNIFGAFKSRLAGRPEANSTFIKEISVILADIFIMPFLMSKAILFLAARGVQNKKTALKKI